MYCILYVVYCLLSVVLIFCVLILFFLCFRLSFFSTPLVMMEAMKMEHVIRAPIDGIISSIYYSEGDFVEGGKTVVAFEENGKK